MARIERNWESTKERQRERDAERERHQKILPTLYMYVISGISKAIMVRIGRNWESARERQREKDTQRDRYSSLIYISGISKTRMVRRDRE